MAYNNKIKYLLALEPVSCLLFPPALPQDLFRRKTFSPTPRRNDATWIIWFTWGEGGGIGWTDGGVEKSAGFAFPSCRITNKFETQTIATTNFTTYTFLTDKTLRIG